MIFRQASLPLTGSLISAWKRWFPLLIFTSVIAPNFDKIYVRPKNLGFDLKENVFLVKKHVIWFLKEFDLIRINRDNHGRYYLFLWLGLYLDFSSTLFVRQDSFKRLKRRALHQVCGDPDCAYVANRFTYTVHIRDYTNPN